MPVIPKYNPKPVHEKFIVGYSAVELDNEDRMVTISSDSGDIVLDFEIIPDLVQFLAWAMRERMEVTADEEAEQVRKSDGDEGRGEV